MLETRWQKIVEAVARFYEIAPENRTTWLEEFCADDAELKAEIESLLAFESEAENFLENSPAPLAAQILTENEMNKDGSVGKLFGNYRIVREIGRGGMGAVFLVERADGEFKQLAALKIVRQTILDWESENYFRRERQILASLNHPNVARLLDGGVSENGEPYLVMEYVEGEPLLDFANNHRLDLNERLKLFLKICSAVAYAHRNLVVHRDIKPSNILVAADGEPKLLDFGLAKILDESLDQAQTATGMRAMTPAYASPEQLRGENVTTASDIYSLGVALFELLTGNRPYKANGFMDIVRQIAVAEPTRPSDAVETNPNTNIRHPQLKGDLDNIVLTALKKEPERRYKTVEAFSEDVKRHLEGLPVRARANTFSYRAAKFIKRNVAVSIIAALLLLSLLGGIILTSWQAGVAREERDRAEKRFNDVRKISKSLLFEISPQIERLPGSTEARETIVSRALEYLDSLAAESSADESLQSELASAYEQVGDVQGKPGKPNLGNLEGATETYRKAQKIRQSLAEKYPNDAEIKRLLAANFQSIGDLRFWSSDIDGALENYRRAISIYETLVAAPNADVQINLDLINSQLATAKVFSGNGNYDDSIPIYRRSLDALEKLQAAKPFDTEIARLIGGSHINLAYDLSWKDEMTEAGEEVKKSVAVGEPLFAAHPNDTKLRHSLWYSYYFAGSVFQDANPPLARLYLEKSVNLANEAVSKDRLDFQSKQDLAQSYSLLGDIMDSQKQSNQAIEYFEKALAILDELTNDEPQHTGYFFDLANTYTRIGEAQKQKNDFVNAGKNFENALLIQERMREKDAADNMLIRAVAFSYENLAQVSEKVKDCEKAETYKQKSFELFAALGRKNALSEYDRKRVEKLQKSAPDNCRNN